MNQPVEASGAAALSPALNGAELDALRLDRQADLIRRWAGGGKLTNEEMAEVHPILPAEVLATPCKHVFTGRLRHRRSYEDYAAQFGKGLRTVKRWAAIGRDKGDLCPLDDLAQFPAWWGRCMEYSIPSDVLAVCLGKPSQPAAAAASAPAPAAVAPASPAENDSPRHLINIHDLAAIGLKENVERLSKIHRANLELLEKAFNGSSDTELQLRQRNAEKSSRMLSDAQRNYDEYQKSHGELVVLADVKRDLLRIHTTMANSFVGLLVGLGIHRERALSSADTWFRQLRESRFAAGTAPDLRPAADTVAA